MTILAHNAAVLEVPVDSALLFSGDEMYARWVAQVVERVGDTKDAEAARMRQRDADG